MNITLRSLAELPTLFAVAADGDVAAVTRLALLMEVVDRDEDAAKLWRLGAQLGDPVAERYAREHVSDNNVIHRPDEDGMVTEVLQRQREQLAGLVDHTWLDEQLRMLLQIPLCAIHRRLERDKDGDYHACGECYHVWRTKAEFDADVERVRRELDEADRLGWNDDTAATSILPLIGKITGDTGEGEPGAASAADDGFTTVPHAAGLKDEDICPLCSHTF